MAYNTKPIVKDVEGNPISQYYNPDTDSYEPVEGQAGANKVLVENNDLSLIPILDKLSQLTGTVIDEETRKSNEAVRQDNEQLRVQLYSDLMAELDRIAQIQEQVPETVIDSINDIRDKLLETEQGLWTPKLIGAEVEGEHDYAIQVGTYYKIGKFVICMFQIALTSKDSNMSGVVRISGLPFTIDKQDYGASFSRGSGIIFNANDMQITGYGAGVFVQLNVLPSGGLVYANAVQNNASIRGSISYVTM